MSKIGVGVGEDFPVDDGPGKTGNEQDDRAEYEEWRRRRAEWRAQRERWRSQRDEWRAKRRAFKEKVRNAAHETFGPEWESYRRARHGYYRHWHFPFGILMPILGIVLFFSLLSAVFKAPFFFLGLAALAWFFIAHRHHHRYEGCDYDIDAKPAAPQPAAQPAPPPPPPAQS
ncbi:MAG TPA: hypothetical protein VGT78_12555 [Rhizomicrobium sp.]|nr:hypothetical protein [Rhizomicrobium sp.]